MSENKNERMSKVAQKKESGGVKTVSDMKLSACAALGQISFHL